MDTLPPYVIHEIMKRSSFQDRLLTLQCVCVDWRRWTPMSDIRTFKVSDFERLRVSPGLWRGQVPSREYFQSNQAWLEIVIREMIPRIGSGSVRKIRFDSIWPRVPDGTPALFCAPEGFKRWTLTAQMFEIIRRHCGRTLEELILTEDNFLHTFIEKDSYPILTPSSFPRLRRLAIARVDASFGPCLRQLSLRSLRISGENAPLDTANPDKLTSLHLVHPFPESYRRNAYNLSLHFPNLETHSEQLLVELEQLSETAQRRRLTEYRQMPNFRSFRIQLGPEYEVRTELNALAAGFGLPKLENVNVQVRQMGDLASGVRFFSQLREIKVEGILNRDDALAIFTALPALTRLNLACRWISDDNVDDGQTFDPRPRIMDTEEDVEQEENGVNASNFKIAKLRTFNFTLWECAPLWLQSIIAVALGNAPSLCSFRLEDFGDYDDDRGKDDHLLQNIGLAQTRNHLKKLHCRVRSVEKTSETQLRQILQCGGAWPKLSAFTWHAARLHFDHVLVAEFHQSFPNLKSFTILPPSGPLRPLLSPAAGSSGDGDEAQCNFDHQSGSLAELMRGLGKLRQLRLFASSIFDRQLVRAIASHKHLEVVKLWTGILPDNDSNVVTSADCVLREIESVRQSSYCGEGYLRRPLFVEVFTLSSANNNNNEKKLPLEERSFDCGSVYFLANGRANGIDEQRFFFP